MVPWRLRILLALWRGFLRDPRKALRLARNVNVDMVSVYRYKLQIHGVDFLRDLLQEAAVLGIRPFLMWGTLLGFIRENGFMAHDYDIDMALLADDYAKKDALIAAMLRRGYRLRHDVPHTFSFNTRDGLLHLDIDMVYAYRGQMVTSAAFGKEGESTAHGFPADAFEPLERKSFPGYPEVWVPAKPEKVLECMYGDWRKPKDRYDFRTGPQNRIAMPDAG